MPRFFFHIYNDVVTRDAEGMELPDAEAAVREAHRGARSLAAEQVLREGRLALDHRLEVEDSSSEIIATVTFGDAVRIEW